MGDYSAMDDPTFLAERRRVREEIAALQAEYEALTEEFDRRAGAEWSKYRSPDMRGLAGAPGRDSRSATAWRA